MTEVLSERRAGVLLHPTSLPGDGERGRLGADAYRFVDFLRSGGFTVWQTLPLGPTDAYGSPYCSRSAYAGDPKLIDAGQLEGMPELPEKMAFDAVPDAPRDAYRTFVEQASFAQQQGFATFVRRHRRWLLPYAAFQVAARRFDGAPWWRWPETHRACPREYLRACLVEDREAIRATAFVQYLFEIQWTALKSYANRRGIFIFGDLPFYPDLDCVDVWWDRDQFRVDALGRPEAVAGVPPDYFSADGQLWGNPLYDWKRMAQNGFRWWLERFAGQFRRFDLLRIDHFRALESYWEVPAGAATAREGRWRTGCGDALLSALNDKCGRLPLVAEDLGMITDAVRELRDRYRLPGMVVLQFAFDGMPDNPHLPANHRELSVVYTGTHDNDTACGWFASLDAGIQQTVRSTLGEPWTGMPDALIDAAYASRARLAVVPMQDLLGLGSKARMNIPGTVRGNWRWRFDWDDVDPGVAERSIARAVAHGRWD